MKFETIETILVGVIGLIQICIFVQTLLQIGVFRRIIPEVSSLSISKALIPVADLARLSPQEILENIASDKVAAAASDNVTEKTEVNIIKKKGKENGNFDSICIYINRYLIRNRGAASDFNLIKDIVERNTNAVEEDINLSIGIPLYLGLMGTMIGIVIGLFNMPDLGIVLDTKAKDVMLNDGIALLIGGVKIAMIASFSGLLLTIINSGWLFKGSRKLSEERKNALYTFVQIELLPIINQGLASTLESLQRNLLKFNAEFSTNLYELAGIFDSNKEAIREQKELLDSISKSKVAEMASYNVKVMQQVNLSVEQFEKFNSYLTNVNLLVGNTQHIVNKTNELLARTDNFKSIADNLESRLAQSQALLEFLSAHFKKLEEHKVFASNAVADVGVAISETFKELKAHIQNSSEEVKKFTIDELVLLTKALSQSKNSLEEHKELTSRVVEGVAAAISEIFKDLKVHIQHSSEAVKNFTLEELELLKKALSENRTNLEEHKDFASNTALGVSSAISEIFKELKAHIQNSSEEVKNFTLEELELLKKALSESKTGLGNLEHLSTLKTDVSLFKNSSASQGERLRQAIEDLNRNMAKSIAILEQIERSSLNNKAKDVPVPAKGIAASLKNFFKPKKKPQIEKLKPEIRNQAKQPQQPQQSRQAINQPGVKIEKLKPEVRNQAKPDQQSQQVANQPEVKTEIFFLSNPNSDGSFNVSLVSPVYMEGASIYKFTKVGNNIAEFQIDDRESSVRLALSYPDKSIDPVCEALNAVNPNAKRITTIEPGKAELVNDKWVVNKNHKSKIRYEI